jgi:hypothetical protein
MQGITECGSYDPCITDSWKKCQEFFGNSLKKGDVVVFSWFRERVAKHQSRLPRSTDYAKQSLLRARLNEVISAVLSKGGKVVLADDIPMVCQLGINFQHVVLRLGRTKDCSIS